MIKGGSKSAAGQCKPNLSDNDRTNGVARTRQQGFKKSLDWRMFERAFLAKIGEVGKLLSHGAEFPTGGLGVRSNAPEHVSRLGIFPESKKGLSACRRVEPRSTCRQVSQNALA